MASGIDGRKVGLQPVPQENWIVIPGIVAESSEK
jgi:hypothetical protein